MLKKGLLTVSLAATSVFGANVVSCARPNAENLIYEKNREISSQNYKDNYNYQTGPNKKSGNFDNNRRKTIHDFIAPMSFSYASYIDDNGKPLFFGDKSNMLNVDTPKNYTKEVWKNENLYLQWILIANKDVTKYSDLELEINVKNDPNLKLKANFTKFIKTKNSYRPSNFVHVMKKSQYMPDAVGGSKLDGLKGKKENSYYEVFPVLIQGFIPKETSAGIKNIEVKMNYKYNNVNETLTRDFNINVLDVTLDKDGYGKGLEDRFAFQSNQYAHRSLKYLNGIETLPDNKDGSKNYIDNYEEILSSEKNKEILSDFRKPLQYTNNPSWWGDGFNQKKLIKYNLNIKNKPSNWEIDDYIKYAENGNGKIENIFNDKDVEFQFDFKWLNEYIKLAAKNKVEEVSIDPIKQAREYTFNISTPKGDVKEDLSFGSAFGSGGLINSNGKMSNIGEVYLKTIFPKFLDQLIENLNNLKKNDKDSLLPGLNKLPKVTVLLDELNEQAIYKIWDVIQEANNRNKNNGGEKIYQGIYVGWRANVDWLDEDYLKKNVYNKIDRYIYIYIYIYIITDI